MGSTSDRVTTQLIRNDTQAGNVRAFERKAAFRCETVAVRNENRAGIETDSSPMRS